MPAVWVVQAPSGCVVMPRACRRSIRRHRPGMLGHRPSVLALQTRQQTPQIVADPGIRERAGRPGRPRRRPGKLHADKGYDYPRCRRYLAQRGIGVRIARRGIEDSTRLGKVRWVVERTMSWLLNFRRLALRYDRTKATITALLSLACALICHRRLADHQPRSSSR